MISTLTEERYNQLPDRVQKIPWHTARRFVVAHHYLGYAPCGCKFALGIFAGNTMLGVMIYGRPVARHEDNGKTLELTRMVLFDTPKNSESKSLSLAEKWIKRHTDYERLIAYCDIDHGHTGTIYKAANWSCLGIAPGGGLPWNLTRKRRKAKIGGKKLKFERKLTSKHPAIKEASNNSIRFQTIKKYDFMGSDFTDGSA